MAADGVDDDIANSDNDAAADPSPTHFGSDGGKAAQYPDAPTYAPLVGTTTADEFNTIRASVLPFACWRVDNLRFAFNLSVPDPTLSVEMENLADLLAAHPGCVLSVFGHADPVGGDDLNKKLSGRRAAAIYGLLARRPDIWEDLYSNTQIYAKPVQGDVWGTQSLQMMLSTIGSTDSASGYSHDATKRLQLFSDYMDQVAGPVAAVPEENFLGKGQDKLGKAAFQGCSEFNPLRIFSQADEKGFAAASDKTARNEANAKNRRVMVLLFRKGTRVDPDRWPCPRAGEGVDGCRKRFWKDGEDRRSRQDAGAQREYEQTQDTFGCRFYDRLTSLSPCERDWTANGLLYMQCFSADGGIVLAGRKYKIRGNGNPPMQYAGILDSAGLLRHEQVPPGDYTLTVQGCSEQAKMMVLRMTDTVSQLQLLEDGILAVRVQTPDGYGLVDATVAVTGLPEMLTDDDGYAYFGSVPDGDYSISASKGSFQQLAVTDSQTQAKAFAITANDQPVADSSPEAKVADKRVDKVVVLNSPQPVGKVVRIEGRQVGTRSLSQTNKKLDDNELRPSTLAASSLDIKDNVVLLRQSELVQLTAITEPPNMLVDWTIVQNQSSSTPPQCSPAHAGTTTVETDQAGSFSAVAKLNGTQVFWNFVLVGVELDSSASTSSGKEASYLDLGTNPGRLGAHDSFDKLTYTGVSSGEFVFGKHGWSAQVTANLTGGGPSGDFGCDKVSVQLLQNMVEDDVVGVYDAVLGLSNAGFRLLDTAAGSPDDWDGPAVGKGLAQQGPGRFKQVVFSPFLWSPNMSQVTQAGPRRWVLRAGDSPAIAFETKPAGKGKLSRIRGATEFRTALAAFSKDSVNAISIYADTVWLADYTGKVDPGLAGEWSTDGAVTTIRQPWKPFLGTHTAAGTPAWNALLEIFPPFAAAKSNEPKRYIDKP